MPNAAEKIDLAPPERRFVPRALKVDAWEPFEKLYAALLEEEVGSPDALYAWLLRWSELRAVLSEEGTRRMVATSCDTADKAASEAYLAYIREIGPKVQEWENKLERKYYESPHRAAVRARGLEQLDRAFAASIELFDARNIALNTKANELVHRYDETTGGWMVSFQGAEYTVQQMAKFLHDPDRAVRRASAVASAEARLRDREKLDRLYDELLGVRAEIAGNLGLASYRDYAFRGNLRDYTPEDCKRFHAAIEAKSVPILAEIHERRRSKLGLKSLAPFDLEADLTGRPPLKPFETIPELTDKTQSLFEDLDPRLGARFRAIRPFMDLESRKGKAPGGYQATFEEQRRPFIFANLVGLHGDLSTLVHESGHAFHAVESRDQPLSWLQHAAMEFCEVSSMSQELMMLGGLSRFYPEEEDRRRAAVQQWESAVFIFCWVAVIDGLQHWIYENPGHAPADRRAKFTELYRRYLPSLDWSETPEGALENYWQRQLHLYHAPFYYIEYAIAELGALQVYRNFRADPAGAVTKLLAAQRLGGGAPAPKLFETAGARFDLGPGLLGELMAMAEEELRKLWS